MSEQSPPRSASTKGFWATRKLFDDPDPTDEELREQRRDQWRPISRNPFADSDTEQPGSDVQLRDSIANGDDIKLQSVEKPPYDRTVSTQSKSESAPRIGSSGLGGGGGLAWVNLFYDLAWTATFSSLTQNGRFDGPWDIGSYTTFFVLLWWIWASQAQYSVYFYTNDWFHLACTFFQLVIFGMLAATTRGFDVTTYILHSPGISNLDTKSIHEIDDPKRFRDEKLAKDSIDVIVISVTLSRFILLIQYLRVFHYARRTAQEQGQTRVPPSLRIIPTSLFISLGFFIAASVVSMPYYGVRPLEAKLKFVFWGAGLLFEVLAHIQTSRLNGAQSGPNETPAQARDKDTPMDPVPTLESPNHGQVLPMPHSKFTLRSRLEAITTIILGEGINGIAGTLYAVVSAPGLGRSIAANILCSAVIVYFLAYLYFEGPTGNRDPKGSGGRLVSWLLLHFLFLLGIILLLLGVKNQFLLTSILSSMEKTFKTLNEEMMHSDLSDPVSTDNLQIKTDLLRLGISWSYELDSLINLMTKNGSDPLKADGSLTEAQESELGVWSYRLSLNIVVKIYEAFMGGEDKVPEEIRQSINSYRTNMTWPLQDYHAESNPETDSVASLHYYTIITKLLYPSLLGTRYIMGLAGGLLMCLGVLNLVHSRPRDRYQWGIIFSRFLMGFLLLLLLLLNLGRYQSLFVSDYQAKKQAGVFQWLWAYWVLPTIAVAFGLQVIAETILIWLARLRTNDPNRTKRLRQLAWASLKHALKRAVLKLFRMLNIFK